ncbi:MAG: F0F1 ATP synthase subunit gamma [Candidatus Omnitrophica bacterium]|nr:F0F1 ATP synthase subunit gamma [Candidatus Omnitrophota bacterium]
MAELRRDLANLYVSGEVDAIYVVYSHFKTLTTFKAITEKLLPLERPTPVIARRSSEIPRPSLRGGRKADEAISDSGQAPQSSEIASSPSGTCNDGMDAKEYIFEPSAEAVFQKLVPQFFDAKVRMIFLEAIVSEQIARMMAMHQATKNAKEMIDSLVLKRNKARQASITKELIEIVSGSQALKIK